MTKVRNQRFYSSDPEQLKLWAEEIEYIGGRQYKVDYEEGSLTIFARPQRRNKHGKKKEHQERNKRAEAAGRRHSE